MTMGMADKNAEIEKLRSIFAGKRALRDAALAQNDLEQVDMIDKSILTTIRHMIYAKITFDDLRLTPYTE